MQPAISIGDSSPFVNPADTALDLLRRGCKVVPVPLRQKGPVLTGWQNLRIAEADLPQHFPMSSNIGVLMGDPSDGLTDTDLDCPEAVSLADHFLPDTWSVFGRPSKPRSHREYISPGAKTEKFIDTDGTCLVEIRSTGCQTIFPGSIHPSGELVSWDQDGKPAQVDPETLRQSVAKLAAASLLARQWPAKGSRQDAALALAGGLLRGGWSEDQTSLFIEAVTVAAGDEESPKRAGAVAQTARKVGDTPTTGWKRLCELTDADTVARVRGWLGMGSTDRKDGEPVNQTDLGNARRLVVRHGANVKHCWPWGKWLVWDEATWCPDETGEVLRYAKETVRAIYREASETNDKDHRESLVAWALKSENESRINSMVSLARSEQGIPVLPTELDADPMLFSVQNGVFDFRENVFREHRKTDLITKTVPIAFDPKAECPLWLAFLGQIMAGNQAIIQYLQKAFGYSLTGDVAEHILHILHGTGANGKTVLLNMLLALTGPYGKQAAPDLLLAKKYENHPTELADLLGVRALVSSETDEGRRLAESLIKQLTGGDMLKAHFMRGDFFSFPPTHKIWMATNHKPIVRGTDHGMWRRLRLLPFTVTIPDEEQDKKLPKKLLTELPGILNWAIRGCLLWQRDGLNAPKEVMAATETYRVDMDTLQTFIDDNCIVNQLAKVRSSALYTAFLEWARETGEREMSQKAFTTRMQERGFDSARDRSGVWLQGIGLKNNNDGKRDYKVG